MTEHITPSFDDLADSAFIRASHLVRDPKNPQRTVPLQISIATLWRWCNDPVMGFPQPLKLSAGVTAWKVGEVRAWLKARSNAASGKAA